MPWYEICILKLSSPEQMVCASLEVVVSVPHGVVTQKPLPSEIPNAFWVLLSVGRIGGMELLAILEAHLLGACNTLKSITFSTI